MNGAAANRLEFILLVSVTVFWAGCISHPLERPVRQPQPLPAQFQEARASTASRPGAVSSKLVEDRRSFQRSQLTLQDENSGSTDAITCDYYWPRNRKPKAEKTPAIIILPIMGGTTYPVEELFARAFVRRGFACLITHRPNIKEEVRDLEDIDRLLGASIRDTRRVLDWLAAQPNIDAKRLGVFGVSLGAIRGALVTALDPRVKAAVLGLVGGDLPYILAYSEDKDLSRERERILARNQLTPEEAEEYLREAIQYEPLALAPAVDAARVMLVIAACDRVVPARKGWELRRAMGNPETIQLFSGHYSTVIHVPYLRYRASKFFREKFAEAQGP